MHGTRNSSKCEAHGQNTKYHFFKDGKNQFCFQGEVGNSGLIIQFNYVFLHSNCKLITSCQCWNMQSVLQMDPGQDLLLAALSESGICPNDIGQFDVDAQDVAQPSTTQQVRWWELTDHCRILFLMCSRMLWFLLLFQSISISALGVGVGTESADVVRNEPPTSALIVSSSIRMKFICCSVI